VTDSLGATMDRRKWLLRLIYTRFCAFAIFILIPWLLGRFSDNPGKSHDMLLLMGAVLVISALWLALVRLNKSYVWQSYAQIILDIFLITATVNRTEGIDSYFSNLYFLEIVMASILLDRRGAFLAGTLSSVIHFAHLDLIKYGAISSNASEVSQDWQEVQFIIAVNIFAYTAVAYLSNYLAEGLRHAGAQLEKSTGQMAFLQAFNDRIIDSMDSGLITTDGGGRIYLFNRAAENITGRRVDEALHMTIRELFPEVSHVEAGRSETWTRRTDGKEIYLRFSVSPVMIDDKDTAGYVWCIDDLTELRSLERQVRQKEQMAAIGAMSAGIAHEIRNPLASITGSFNLLHKELQLSPDQGRLAEIITRETERLNRTITEFLSYSRTPDPKPTSMDLSNLISETVSLMRNSPEVKPSHSIETKLEPVTRPVDGSMMRQVFYNLATNAFRAMPDGGKLTIRLEPRNGGARIQFEDTGRGMDEDELKKLFVPFHSSFAKGTGLGLPIVYQIVNAHNGTISVKSRRGMGSVFAIDL
jgi:two-component system sensor histidine kinase PilS (NtrC family)